MESQLRHANEGWGSIPTYVSYDAKLQARISVSLGCSSNARR